MHIRYCYLIISICFFSLAGSLDLQSQQVIVNIKGDKIVIFPDGSWRHFEPADSVLIRPNMRSDSPFNLSENSIDDKNPIDPTMGESAEKRLAIEYAAQLRYETDQARATLVDVTTEKFNVEAKLNQALENPDIIEVNIRAKLEEDYIKATEEVKNAKMYHKQMSKFAEKALDIPDMEGDKREKALSKLMAKHSVFLASTEWKPTSSRENKMISLISTKTTEQVKKQKLNNTSNQKTNNTRNQKANKTKEQKTKKNSVNIDETPATNDKGPNIDSMPGEAEWEVPNVRPYSREPYECQMQIDEIDEVTQHRRLVVKTDQLFTHTDEELRPYFRDDNLIECNGYLSSVEGFRYLTVKFIIASPNAKKNFGMLQNKALLRIKMINGTFLNFYNLQEDRGEIDNYTGNTIFTGNYALGTSAEKVLLNTEVDKMRIVWSTGYEDYDIHEVDFFINQLNCLNKN